MGKNVYDIIFGMAEYKVPQDVEADDKLIGPFSFRQFVYLIVVALCGFGMWGLGSIFIGLALIPLPFLLFFGALALPLKKDQPMETYMMALVSYYLKPRKRLWKADGIESTVEITVPKTTEVKRIRDLSEAETSRRLSYLAEVVDTEGWAVRGVSGSPMHDDLSLEALETPDMLDFDTPEAMNINRQMAESDRERHDMIVNNMKQAFANPQPVGVSEATGFSKSIERPALTPLGHDRVIQPITNPEAEEKPEETKKENDGAGGSAETINPVIIDLANNTALSVETIAKEANRLAEKEKNNSEVFVSLR